MKKLLLYYKTDKARLCCNVFMMICMAFFINVLPYTWIFIAVYALTAYLEARDAEIWPSGIIQRPILPLVLELAIVIVWIIYQMHSGI